MTALERLRSECLEVLRSMDEKGLKLALSVLKEIDREEREAATELEAIFAEGNR